MLAIQSAGALDNFFVSSEHSAYQNKEQSLSLYKKKQNFEQKAEKIVFKKETTTSISSAFITCFCSFLSVF